MKPDKFVAAFAKAGVDVGSGVSLLQLEQVNQDLVEEISVQRQEAAFKAKALQAGADLDTRLAGDVRRAGDIRSIATGLTGIGSAAGRLS